MGITHHVKQKIILITIFEIGTNLSRIQTISIDIRILHFDKNETQSKKIGSTFLRPICSTLYRRTTGIYQIQSPATREVKVENVSTRY